MGSRCSRAAEAEVVAIQGARPPHEAASLALAERLQAEEERAARLEAESQELARRLQEETDERLRLQAESLRLQEESAALARRLQREEDGVVAVDAVSFDLTPTPRAPSSAASPPTASSDGEAPPPPSTDGEDLRRVVAGLTIAQRHSECCICFDGLHEEPIATLTCRGRNACAHFLHEACAREMLLSMHVRSKTCPQCRASFDGVRRVPAITEDPDGWFFCVDASGEGTLTRQELLNVLVAQFPLDLERLEIELPRLWARWDLDGSGVLSRREIADPQRGLAHFVRAHLLTRPPLAAPGPTATRREWFDYFDDDCSGALTRPQVLTPMSHGHPHAYAHPT